MLMKRFLAVTLAALAIVLVVHARSEARGDGGHGGGDGGHHGFEGRGGERHDFDRHDGHGFHHGFRNGFAVGPVYPFYPYDPGYYPGVYGPTPNYYWYCPSYGAYYPSVTSCPEEWTPVPTS